MIAFSLGAKFNLGLDLLKRPQVCVLPSEMMRLVLLQKNKQKPKKRMPIVKVPAGTQFNWAPCYGISVYTSLHMNLLREGLLLAGQKHAKCVGPLELAGSRRSWLRLKRGQGKLLPNNLNRNLIIYLSRGLDICILLSLPSECCFRFPS